MAQPLQALHEWWGKDSAPRWSPDGTRLAYLSDRDGGKAGTSDIWSGYTYLRVHQWQDPELYWRYPPIAYVQNIRTPLFILHSEEDLRCPIEQAEQLFTALKLMRREVCCALPRREPRAFARLRHTLPHRPGTQDLRIAGHCSEAWCDVGNTQSA